MDSILDFLTLLFSCAVGLLTVSIFKPQGFILGQVILLGTISIVYISLVYLRYKIF